MTSNIGIKKLQDFGTGVGFETKSNSHLKEEQKRDVLKKELKNYFAPEFLNRIDEVIIFNSLNKENIKKIVQIELDKLNNRLLDKNYIFNFDEKIVDMISDVGFDDLYGARPIKRVIQEKIEDFISEEVLMGNVNENEEYQLTYEKDKILFKTSKKKTKKEE